MSKNVKILCSRKSWHIGMKFFWLANSVKQGKISVKHCPTNKM